MNKEDIDNNNMESSDSMFDEQAKKIQLYLEKKNREQEERIKELENLLKSKVINEFKID
jgi:hypothetical protein